MARCVRGSYRYRQHRAAKAMHEARDAARRNWRLHNWTTRIVARAADLTVVKPRSIKAATATAHGTPNDPGAEVVFKAKVNRRILDQAPAMAIAMLEYKAAEAGCRLTLIDAAVHKTDVPAAIVAAAKTVRKAKHDVSHANR